MTDKANAGIEFTGPGGERARAFELSGGLGALLAGALFGGLAKGDADAGDVADHPLLKRMGIEPPAPYRAASREEFMTFFEGWAELKIGDVVEVREGYALDKWPTKGEQAIVSQVLETPLRRGTAYTEQVGRRNDVALLFVTNTDAEVMAAMAEAAGEAVEAPHIAEFLYDSRRLKKIGNVFE